MNVFGEKFDAILVKINQMNKFVHRAYFWMTVLIIPEMNITDDFSLI